MSISIQLEERADQNTLGVRILKFTGEDLLKAIHRLAYSIENLKDALNEYSELENLPEGQKTMVVDLIHQLGEANEAT